MFDAVKVAAFLFDVLEVILKVAKKFLQALIHGIILVSIRDI
jgi:hypothetical protein